MQTHAIGKSVLKTTHADGDSTAGTLQVKLVAEQNTVWHKKWVQMPALVEIKNARFLFGLQRLEYFILKGTKYKLLLLRPS